MKKIIAIILIAAGLLAVSTPANAAGGCGKAGPSCRSTLWYNMWR